MPTIAEPISPIADAPHFVTALAPQILAGILADLADRGVCPTPLTVLAYAFDTGIPESVAVQVVTMMDGDAKPMAAEIALEADTGACSLQEC